MVVVTGVPGAGKSTLARAVAEVTGSAFVSLDEIKESLHAAGVATDDRHALRLLAEQRFFELVGSAEDGVVADIWIAPGRDTARVADGFLALALPLVEVVCRVPAEVAVSRYASRVRGGPHLPPDDAMLARIRQAVDDFEPMGICPVVEVDTSVPVDAARLVERLAAV